MTTPERDDRAAAADSRVAVAWRAASHEGPPAALDAAILAAARREAGAGPQGSRAQDAMRVRRHWWPLAAAATLAAIAVGLLQLTTPDQLGAPAPGKSTVTDMPAPTAGPAPQQRAETARREDAATDNATVKDTIPHALVPSAPPVPATGAAALATRKDTAHVPVSAQAPEPFPAGSPSAGTSDTTARKPAPAPAIAGGAAAPERYRSAPPPAEATADAAAPPRPAQGKLAAGLSATEKTEEARVKERAPLPVAEWIALIRRLRDEGKTVDAARELAAFRTAHADHDRLLPPDLRDWRPAEK